MKTGVVPAGIVSLLAAAALFAPAAQAFDPGVEAKNFSKVEERQTIYDTPQYQLQLRVQSQENGLAALQAQAADPERFFEGDLCWNASDGCAGDIRLYDWEAKGYGIVKPVRSRRATAPRCPATCGPRSPARRSGPAS